MNLKTTCSRPIILSLTLISAVATREPVVAEETFHLSGMDLSDVEQDWGSPRSNRSTEGHPLSIGGQKFDTGVGTHAFSQFIVELQGTAQTFTAQVGVDDEVGKGHGSVTFQVVGDGKTLWESPVLHGGDAPLPVNVKLDGVKQLALVVGDGGDGNAFDHADWADGQVTMREGKALAATPPREPPVILTPKPSPRPRINSARIFGVRPGSPFLFTIAATGDRPLTFSAEGLPAGLQLDPDTGRITGVLKEKGEHTVRLRARNALGEAQGSFKIICGPQIGLTPTMGWNSWNCFAGAVTAEKVKSAADAMVRSGLINHGWTYINIDDFWQIHRNSKDPTLQGPQRDDQGRILPNPRFPDMKGLAAYVHGLGLKIGLYSSPGPWTCGGCVGSYQHEDQDARRYGEWDFDYLKYDWCSYGDIARGDNSTGALQKPYRVMRAALDQVPRDILFSFCQYGMGNVWEWGAEAGGNSWRTTGDIQDNWGSVARIGFGQDGHEHFAGAGHFNDPDMLVIGRVGWGPRLRPTHLTPNEQYTHISLWCLLDSPLLIGCDMTQLDEFTASLLTNDEVLEVNQDPLGQQARRVHRNGPLEIWAKDMEDGSKTVGLFNRGLKPARATATWADLGLSGKQAVRDLWRQQDLGEFQEKFEADVPAHGVILVRIRPAR